jgi:hypothetical protein
MKAGSMIVSLKGRWVSNGIIAEKPSTTIAITTGGTPVELHRKD